MLFMMVTNSILFESSFLHSISSGFIGFVSDPRRLNVAITRPRRGLVVVGSTSTLRRGSRDWEAYLNWADEEVDERGSK